MALTIRIDGVKKSRADFQKLSTAAQRRISPKAVRAAAAPILKMARRNAPRKNRIFARSLALVIRRYKTGAVAVVGQDRNKIVKAKKIKHAGGISGRGQVTPIHLVENRTRPHLITGRGGGLMRFRLGGSQEHVVARRVQHPGQPGSGFLAAAARATRVQSLQAYEAKLAAGIAQEVAKL